MSKEKEEIKVALEALEEINSDEQKARIAELREKYILDRNTELKAAEARGRESGRELGRIEGIEMERKENEKKVKLEKIKMVKKMKEKNMPIETIAELTELSIEEIEKI